MGFKQFTNIHRYSCPRTRRQTIAVYFKMTAFTVGFNIRCAVVFPGGINQSIKLSLCVGCTQPGINRIPHDIAVGKVTSFGTFFVIAEGLSVQLFVPGTPGNQLVIIVVDGNRHWRAANGSSKNFPVTQCTL